LLERLIYWEDLTKSIPIKEATEGRRKPYVRITSKMVAEMVMLREQGLSIHNIAVQLGVSDYSVRSHLNLHQEQSEAMAN
jgi:hypothetical protein